MQNRMESLGSSIISRAAHCLRHGAGTRVLSVVSFVRAVIEESGVGMLNAKQWYNNIHAEDNFGFYCHCCELISTVAAIASRSYAAMVGRNQS
jgi:hypothetical protein